jgi:quinol monooxygenase YgiN
MGAAPTTFSFVQGLEQPAAAWEPDGRCRRVRQGGGDVGHLEVTARLKIRPGQRDGFNMQAAEIMRVSREQDTRTLRYDWFITSDGTQCEVHEAYVDEAGLIEHNEHVMAARAVLFDTYAYDHRMCVYGEISDELRGLFDQHAGGVSSYSFLQGLGTTAGV